MKASRINAAQTENFKFKQLHIISNPFEMKFGDPFITLSKKNAQPISLQNLVKILQNIQRIIIKNYFTNKFSPKKIN